MTLKYLAHFAQDLTAKGLKLQNKTTKNFLPQGFAPITLREAHRILYRGKLNVKQSIAALRQELSGIAEIE